MCASVVLGIIASALCYLVRVQPQAYFYLGVLLLVPGSIGAREAAASMQGDTSRSGSAFAVRFNWLARLPEACCLRDSPRHRYSRTRA